MPSTWSSAEWAVEHLRFGDRIEFWGNDAYVEIAKGNSIIQMSLHARSRGQNECGQFRRSPDGAITARQISVIDALDFVADAVRSHPAERDRMVDFVAQMVGPMVALRFAAGLG